MKILVFGAGIIGTTYAWQLSEAGYDVSILVRKGKKQVTEKEGISINCTDFRGNQKKQFQTVYRPTIIEDLSPQNNYDFIIVSIRYDQQDSVLPIIKEKGGKANIVLFYNNWMGSEEIKKFLRKDQYLFGFPSKMGGGRDEKGINCVISGSNKACTMLGEEDGDITPRLIQFSNALRDADMAPKISKQIIPWLCSHYAMIAALCGGIVKAGSTKAFANDSRVVKEMILAMREGFEVCKIKGVNPKKVPPHHLFYLPLFIITFIARKIYGMEELRLIFDGHINHSPNEMKQMYFDVLNTGLKNNIDMFYFLKYKELFNKN